MRIEPDLIAKLAADCPYGPGGFLIDEILDLDEALGLVLGRMPTFDDLPITREQRSHPVRHPRHVSGGLMVHMTGMIAYVHAYCLLGLRHGDGWIGYGAKIHSARFRALAPPGEPLLLECHATQVRRGDETVFARYRFRFSQEQTLVYEGDQSAMWMLTKDGEGGSEVARQME
jgi:hypothetical protein